MLKKLIAGSTVSFLALSGIAFAQDTTATTLVVQPTTVTTVNTGNPVADVKKQIKILRKEMEQKIKAIRDDYQARIKALRDAAKVKRDAMRKAEAQKKLDKKKD